MFFHFQPQYNSFYDNLSFVNISLRSDADSLDLLLKEKCPIDTASVFNNYNYKDSLADYRSSKDLGKRQFLFRLYEKYTSDYPYYYNNEESELGIFKYQLMDITGETYNGDGCIMSYNHKVSKII